MNMLVLILVDSQVNLTKGGRSVGYFRANKKRARRASHII